jgi:mRNA interferase HicA
MPEAPQRIYVRSFPIVRVPCRFDVRTYLSDTCAVRGNEFIRRVQRYAKDRGLRFEWRPDLGKGSHGVLILGDHRTVVRNAKDELKTGTLHAMLRQLGLSLDEI